MRRFITIMLAILLIVPHATALAEDWQCEFCNQHANGSFCSNCGNARPVKDAANNEEQWVCASCGETAHGNFCANCGSKMPKASDIDNPSGNRISSDVVSNQFFSDDDKAGKYKKATEYFDSKNYAQAIDLLLQINGYHDADTILAECVKQQASIYFEDKDYSAAQSLLLQYPLDEMSNILMQCNDHCFILDLQKALCARWAHSTTTDSSIMSNSEIKKYYSSLVASEMQYLEKYSTLTFSDATLSEYAHEYIEALRNQQIGIDDYYGVDQSAYNEYWSIKGANKREQIVYLINRRYGLEFPLEYEETFKDFILVGQVFDMQFTTEEMLIRQLFSLQYSMKTDEFGGAIFVPTTIKNRTDYQIGYLRININFCNTKGEVLTTYNLFAGNNVNSGGIIAFSSISPYLNFDSISFDYEFIVANGTYDSGTITGRIAPQVQYSFENGLFRKNGDLASGQPLFEIIDLTAAWRMHKFYSQELYVPTLEFSVKNVGDAPAENVVVRCTFTNQDTREIWSEESEYLIDDYNSALAPGYSKISIICSSVGYKTKISNVPNLVAEIYVNDHLVKTTSLAT